MKAESGACHHAGCTCIFLGHNVMQLRVELVSPSVTLLKNLTDNREVIETELTC